MTHICMITYVHAKKKNVEATYNNLCFLSPYMEVAFQFIYEK
jgi:hypothetical protein